MAGHGEIMKIKLVKQFITGLAFSFETYYNVYEHERVVSACSPLTQMICMSGDVHRYAQFYTISAAVKKAFGKHTKSVDFYVN